ncbi:alpha/beta fold hydrolase [Hymenobacter sp. RP-2-7]|uniref:Alpha/beta fold hydrolase n=1 Tax=Hymenobacter polaris TaxID=2682546 RepID=A0A7Y0FML3_9BACT|nr:alpha/beta hydrolase [Hymenobacter polaris]NML65998.1 alpha/beta fold hydrolase [Hymenobacter polaris]
MNRLLLFFLLLTTAAFGQQRPPLPQPVRAFGQAAPSPPGETQYGNNPQAGHYVQAGDAKIYYEVYGQGRPFLVLHGALFGSTYELHQLLDSLRLRYQVIAVSTRGYGKSELGHSPITFEQKVDDVLAVLNAVTRDSAVIFGFSDGGHTGFKLASLHPERVRKLITLGAGELYPGMRQFDFDVQHALLLDTAYFRQQRALMPEPQRLGELFAKTGAFYTLLTIDKTMFGAIRCPVLVMAGDRD